MTADVTDKSTWYTNDTFLIYSDRACGIEMLVVFELGNVVVRKSRTRGLL